MRKAEPKENLKKILKEQREEYQRYLGVLSEDFQSKLEAIADQYGDIRFNIEIIKEDVEFIKNSLKL